MIVRVTRRNRRLRRVTHNDDRRAASGPLGAGVPSFFDGPRPRAIYFTAHSAFVRSTLHCCCSNIIIAAEHVVRRIIFAPKRVVYRLGISFVNERFCRSVPVRTTPARAVTLPVVYFLYV